jgi:hypothetical protein
MTGHVSTDDTPTEFVATEHVAIEPSEGER